MKINERQLLVLVSILKDSLIVDDADRMILNFSIGMDNRRELIELIMSQQSLELVDIGGLQSPQELETNLSQKNSAPNSSHILCPNCREHIKLP